MTTTPPIESAARSRLHWPLVMTLMAFCFISHINRLAITVAANHGIMAEYHLDELQMGFVFSSFLFVYTLFMIPGGMFIDRAGVRRVMVVMGLGSALFGALSGSVGWGLVIGGRRKQRSGRRQCSWVENREESPRP